MIDLAKGIQFPTFVPYGKATLELYVSGCSRDCFGCHNPELRKFKDMTADDTQELMKKLLTRRDFFDIISISGGDLLCHPEEKALEFVNSLKSNFPEKDFWLFTGEDHIENVPQWAKETFSCIKIGHFDEKLKQPGFPASSNQKLLKKGKDY